MDSIFGTHNMVIESSVMSDHAQDNAQNEIKNTIHNKPSLLTYQGVYGKNVTSEWNVVQDMFVFNDHEAGC